MATSPRALDPNQNSALHQNNTPIQNIISHANYIGINTVILGELLADFECGNHTQHNRKELNNFLESPRVNILPINEETADVYGHTFSNLKAKGKPIPTNDLWIAATAMQHGLIVCSLDKHFSHIDGLRVAKNLSDLLP